MKNPFLIPLLLLYPNFAFAKQQPMGTAEIIFLVIFAVVAFLAVAFKEQRLNDPSDSTYIYLGEVITTAELLPSPQYRIDMYRQSGNPYKDPFIWHTNDGSDMPPEDVINHVLKTFRRAKIEDVRVVTNNEQELHICRSMHQHGRKAEGKKFKGAIITIIEEIS